MRIRIVIFSLCILLINSCSLPKGVSKRLYATNKSFDLVVYMGKIIVESAEYFYQKDTIELKTPVYIQKLVTKFTGSGSLELNIDSIEVIKIQEDLIYFKNGADIERYLFKYVVNTDSVRVFVSCFYNTDSLYNEKTAKCITNTYTITKGFITNNHDYDYCN